MFKIIKALSCKLIFFSESRKKLIPTITRQNEFNTTIWKSCPQNSACGPPPVPPPKKKPYNSCTLDPSITLLTSYIHVLNAGCIFDWIYNIYNNYEASVRYSKYLSAPGCTLSNPEQQTAAQQHPNCTSHTAQKTPLPRGRPSSVWHWAPTAVPLGYRHSGYSLQVPCIAKTKAVATGAQKSSIKWKRY